MACGCSLLYPRTLANQPSAAKETGTVTSDAPKSTASADDDDNKDSTKTTGRTSVNLNTAEAETGTKTGSKTKGAKETHKTFAPDSPPGGVAMVTPATTAVGTALYKVGDYVTLGWNYTSLQGDPSAIDVLVSCSKASATWTLTTNMTFETSVDYVWDTNDSDDVEQPLLTEMYTLIIKDAEADMTEIPEPGYLGVYSGFTFGLYTPQPYVSYDKWECVGCNAASPGFDSQALSFAVTMSLVTIFSFTWFVTGLGLH